jgi:hypothetical protein
MEPVATLQVGCTTVMLGAAMLGQTIDTEGVQVPVASGDVTVNVSVLAAPAPL